MSTESEGFFGIKEFVLFTADFHCFCGKEDLVTH